MKSFCCYCSFNLWEMGFSSAFWIIFVFWDKYRVPLGVVHPQFLLSFRFPTFIAILPFTFLIMRRDLTAPLPLRRPCSGPPALSPSSPSARNTFLFCLRNSCQASAVSLNFSCRRAALFSRHSPDSCVGAVWSCARLSPWLHWSYWGALATPWHLPVLRWSSTAWT